VVLIVTIKLSPNPLKKSNWALKGTPEIKKDPVLLQSIDNQSEIIGIEPMIF